MSIVQLERLVGDRVRDPQGRVVGRLEGVHADWRGGECVITHYVLSAHRNAISFLFGLLGAEKSGGGIVVPWDKLDLQTMRLSCSLDDLV